MCLFFDKIFYYFLPQGRTHAYAKNGSKINSFSSHLPGGNYGQKGRSKSGILVHWRNLASFFWLTSDKFLFTGTSFKTYIWFDFVELWTYYDRKSCFRKCDFGLPLWWKGRDILRFGYHVLEQPSCVW